MKENVIKTVFAVAAAGLSAYFKVILIPLSILIFVMICDYLSGMVSAWMTKTVSSRVGIVGIVKKACYLLVVAVAMVTDWLIHSALAQAGIGVSDSTFLFGLIVIIWLIINELISILENLAEVGIPLPEFLVRIIKKLKSTVDSGADISAGSTSDDGK